MTTSTSKQYGERPNQAMAVKKLKHHRLEIPDQLKHVDQLE
jgi:hypothetical protein